MRTQEQHKGGASEEQILEQCSEQCGVASERMKHASDEGKADECGGDEKGESKGKGKRAARVRGVRMRRGRD